MSLYLVTGGCGFIGSHLCDALVRDGHRVRVLDDLSTGRVENLPPNVDLVRGCVTDPAAVQRAVSGIDGCFHLAAIASVERARVDWLHTHAVNLGGTIRLLAAIAGSRVPFVYASSAAVYGDCADLPLREDAPTRPLSAYGADKLGCESHARAATFVHGIPTTGLRFFNVYGDRQDPSSPYSGVISIFAERIGRGAPVTVFGDGCQSRDFIAVADVVGALTAAMRHRLPDAPVFNVCTSRSTTVLDLASILGAMTGRPPAIEHHAARSGEIRASLGDNGAAMRSLGLPTPIGLREGLTAWLTG